MTIPVGFTGVELEIGMDDNDYPISIMDYIKYRFALKHPHVAMTKKKKWILILIKEILYSRPYTR